MIAKLQCVVLDCPDALGQAEVASVFAEVFHRLGYLSAGSLASGERWQEMTAGLRGRFEDRDVTQGEARGFLGEPSLVVDRS